MTLQALLLLVQVSSPDWGSVAAILVAIIAAASAEASRRAARNAIKTDAVDASRAKVEEAAYQRAEKFLEGTVTRQDAEIEDLRREVDECRKEATDERKARLDAERKHEEELASLRRDHASEIAGLEEQIRTLAAQVANNGL